MSLTAQEIIDVMTKAKELGVTNLKVDGLEIGMQIKEVKNESIASIEEDVAKLIAPLSPFDNLTEEEVLYWATPYGMELQAKKEATAKQLKEDEALK